MSTSVSGSARRNFMIGSKLWPPAISLAPSPCSCKRAIASSTLVGALVGKLRGIHRLTSLAPGRDSSSGSGVAPAASDFAAVCTERTML